jgi:hypothetical protein
LVNQSCWAVKQDQMPHDSLTEITARRFWGTQANWPSFAPPRWRADAFALVRTHGGKPREGVTKRTDVLIVGELGWPLLDDGRPSNSLARAKSFRVLVASERQFLEWLGKSAPKNRPRPTRLPQGDYAEPHSGIPPATVSGALPAQRGPTAGLGDRYSLPLSVTQ